MDSNHILPEINENLLTAIYLEQSINEINTNTSNQTKIDMNLTNSFNYNKINNFMKALKTIKNNSNDNNLQNNIKNIQIPTIYTRNNTSPSRNENISENSIANANITIEENILNYIMRPVEKNMTIVNNNITRKNRVGHNSTQFANLVYKMENFINPLLKLQETIIEMEEEEEEININKVDKNDKNDKNENLENKINNTFNTNNIKTTNFNSKNRSTAFTNDSNFDNNSQNKKCTEFEIKILPKIPKCEKNKIKNLDQNINEEIENINYINNNTDESFPLPDTIIHNGTNFSLDDLDEIKEINILDYKMNQLENKSQNNFKNYKNNTEFETLGINLNYLNSDPSKINSLNSSYNSNYKNNKNSKILIIDSVLNSSSSYIKENNLNYSKEIVMKYNKTSTTHGDKKKNSKNNLTNKKQINYFEDSLESENIKNKIKNKNVGGTKGINNKDIFDDNCMDLDDDLNISNLIRNDEKNNNKKCVTNSNKKNVHLYSNSININNVYNLNMLNTNELNSTQKKMRRKYFKSDVFDSNFKDNMNKRMREDFNEENIIKENEFNNSENYSKSKMRIHKNLMRKFNHQDSLESGKTYYIENNSMSIKTLEEEEYEIEQIDLKTDFENTQIEEIKREYKNNNNYDDDDYYLTPERKIRQHNTINELTIFKNQKINQNCDKSYNLNYSQENDSLENSFISTVYDLDFINNLLSREQHYKPADDYLNLHNRLDALSRATLIEWLMQLCEEFAFKRDTFHYSVNYVDRFLTKTKNISKNSLQLIGISALSIAAKFEEIQIPKIEDYLIATDNSYTQSEFITAERLLLKTLKWEIMPATIYTWLNWYLCQWDLYVDTFPEVKDKLNKLKNESIFFKKADESSYLHFRQISQLIDLFTIDYSSLVLQSRSLVAASLFLIISKFYDVEYFESQNLNKFEFDNIFFTHFINNSDFVIVEVFSDFLLQSFNMTCQDEDLILALVYSARFLNFEFNYNLPLVMQNVEDHELENGNYEDFLSYQTHNECNFEFLEKIYKQ